MIVWLASYPRSGNTFFRVLLHHLYGINTYSVYNEQYFETLGKASDTIGHEDLPRPLAELDAEPQIHFIKTHELPAKAGRENNMPAGDKPTVYLVRDGRDAVVSHARHILSFVHPQWPRSLRWPMLFRKHVLRQNIFLWTLKRVIEAPPGWYYGGWSQNVFEWLRRPNARLTLVRYEDLIADPVGVLKKVVEELKLDVPLKSEQIPSFEELNAKWPAFFRKGKAGSWREEMPEDLHKLFWEKHGDAMRQLGYKE